MWNDAVSPNGCGPVFYYNVTIVALMDPSDMMTMETNDNVAVFSDLNNGTSYKISVAAVNRVGTGPFSEICVNTSTGNVYRLMMFNIRKQYKHVYELYSSKVMLQVLNAYSCNTITCLPLTLVHNFLS